MSFEVDDYGNHQPVVALVAILVKVEVAVHQARLDMAEAVVDVAAAQDIAAVTVDIDIDTAVADDNPQEVDNTDTGQRLGLVRSIVQRYCSC